MATFNVAVVGGDVSADTDVQNLIDDIEAISDGNTYTCTYYEGQATGFDAGDLDDKDLVVVTADISSSHGSAYKGFSLPMLYMEYDSSGSIDEVFWDGSTSWTLQTQGGVLDDTHPIAVEMGWTTSDTVTLLSTSDRFQAPGKSSIPASGIQLLERVDNTNECFLHTQEQGDSLQNGTSADGRRVLLGWNSGCHSDVNATGVSLTQTCVRWLVDVLGSAAQTVELNHLDAAPTLHQQAVSPGAVTVEAQHLDASPTVHEPAVAYTVDLQHLDASPTLHEAAVSAGAVTVELAHLDAAAAVHEPAVAVGAATVSLGLTRYTFDAGVEGWNTEDGAVTHDTTLSHLGGGSIHFTNVFTAGFDVLRFRENRNSSEDWSASGGTIETWVFIPAGAPGVGWVARHFIFDSGFAQTFSTTGDTTLVPGVWTQVLGEFDGATLADVTDLGVQVSVTDADATVQVNVDTVTQGAHLFAAPTIHQPAVGQKVALNHVDAAPTLHEAAVAPGAATVEAQHLDASPTLHEAAVTTGPVTVALAHLAAAPTVHEPAVAAGAAAVQLDHLAAAPTLHQPTVAYNVALAHLDASPTIHQATVGQTVTLAHLAAAPTVHEPAVSAGAVTVEAAHLAAAPTIHEQAVAPGAVTVEAQHLAAAPTLHQVAVSQGPVTLHPNHLDASPTLHEQAVAAGAVTVEAQHLDAAPTVHEAAVSAVVDLQHLDAAPTVHEPAVTPGAVVVELQHLDTAPTVHEQAVSQGLTIALDHLAASPTIHEPAVSPGAATVETQHLDAAPTVHEPAVVYVAALDHLAAAPTLHEQAVAAGAATVELGHVVAAPTIHSPQVTTGPVTVELQHHSAAPTLHQQAVSQGPATINLAHLAAAPTIHSPQVTAGPVTVALNHLAAAPTLHLLVVAHAVNVLDPTRRTVATWTAATVATEGAWDSTRTTVGAWSGTRHTTLEVTT